MYQRASLSLQSFAVDLIPADAPEGVWNRAKNVMFRNGESHRVYGDTPTLPTTQTPDVCVFLRQAVGASYWVYANDSGIWCHDGSTETEITPVAWTGDASAITTWTACVLAGIVYINCSDRDPVYWNGNPAAACEPLPDWPVDGRCLALRAHKNFLFGIGFISEGDQRVRWSDAAEAGSVPDAWTPAADNLAGFLDLAPLSSPCLDGATMRDDFLIYKAESIWQLSFVGGNTVFQARVMFKEHGLRATNGICAGPQGKHLFVADEGDIQITNGVEVQSILQGRAQRAFYQSVTSQGGVFCAAYLARDNMGIIGYTSAADSVAADIAIMYDFVTGSIGTRELPDVLCMAEGSQVNPEQADATWENNPDTWDEQTGEWGDTVIPQSLDDVVIGGSFGFALISDQKAKDFINGPVSARLEKSGLALGNAKERKMIGRCWPKVEGTAGDVLTFRFGGQEAVGDAVTLSSPVQYTIGQAEHLDVFQQGRYLYMEVSSSSGSPWRLGSIDLEARLVGGW